VLRVTLSEDATPVAEPIAADVLSFVRVALGELASALTRWTLAVVAETLIAQAFATRQLFEEPFFGHFVEIDWVAHDFGGT
jgi:hypothetical protein